MAVIRFGGRIGLVGGAGSRGGAAGGAVFGFRGLKRGFWAIFVTPLGPNGTPFVRNGVTFLPNGVSFLPSGVTVGRNGVSFLANGATVGPNGVSFLPSGITLGPKGVTVGPGGVTFLARGVTFGAGGVWSRGKLGVASAAGRAHKSGAIAAVAGPSSREERAGCPNRSAAGGQFQKRVANRLLGGEAGAGLKSGGGHGCFTIRSALTTAVRTTTACPPPPTKRTDMAKPRLNPDQLTYDQKLTQANEIKTKLTGNVNFPTTRRAWRLTAR